MKIPVSSSRALLLLVLRCKHITRDSHIINNFRKQNDTVVVLVYVDECIVLSRSKTALTPFVTTQRFGPEKFDFTDEGSSCPPMVVLK